MTSEATLDAFRRTVIDMLAEADRTNLSPDFAGADAADMLEHNTRRVALDPLLEALGWSFRDRTEEARVVGDTTLFIDYLGIDRETRVAELIFEAKAWNASWIAGQGSYANRPPTEVVAAAISYLNGDAPKICPVTKEWIEWIEQVRNYVVGVHANSGAIVQRAVISCARWIIILKDPGKAFIDKTIAAEDVIALHKQQMVDRSDDIYTLLSTEALKVAPRGPIHADEIALHLPDPTDIRRLFRAVHVNRNRTTDRYQPQPSIYANAWLIVQRRDGALLTIRSRAAPETIPTNPRFFAEHLSEMQQRSDAMLADMCAAYGTPVPDPSPIGAFPNFVTTTSSSPVRRDATGSNYLVATGTAAHFLHPAPNVACDFHNHEACRMIGQQDEEQAVNARSFERRSFFMTGELHHCAHRYIQIAKQRVPCPIDVFEAKLCCRACTLQDWCWSAEKLKLAPCGGPPAIAAPDVISPRQSATPTTGT